MIRRLNYTGRLRILREDVHVTVTERKEKPPVFKAELDLAEYGLPGDARVYVEAYRQTSWMRFAFGSVGRLAAPEHPELSDFDSLEGILFRVRVTSSDGTNGKLLAEADQIRGRRAEEAEENREPLLTVKPEELGAEVWRLEISDRPRILINKELWDWRAVSLAPPFISLVYPTAFREILGHILLEEKYFDLDDAEYWMSRWLRFATLIPGVPELPAEKSEPDEVKVWINEAVAAFCRRLSMFSRFVMFWRSEDSR
jgi:hypothetical protein